MPRIDFHSHILPHMDHGARRTDTSVVQLTLAHEKGTDILCATSHFYPQEVLPSTFFEARRASFDHLLSRMGDRPRPRIVLGAEVLICEGMEHMKGLSELCFEGTNVLLLEMPFSEKAWTERLYATISEIAERGIRPVFAHVDRYSRRCVERLFDMGFTGQMNADALDGLIKPRHFLKWMDEGVIVALGSDLHGAESASYEPFAKLCDSKKSDMAVRIARIMTATDDLLAGAVLY